MYNEIRIHSSSRTHVIVGHLPNVLSPLIKIRNTGENIETNKDKQKPVLNKYLKQAFKNSWKEKLKKQNIRLLVDLFICDLFVITKDVSRVNVEKLVNEMMLEPDPKQKLKFTLKEYKRNYKCSRPLKRWLI